MTQKLKNYDSIKQDQKDGHLLVSASDLLMSKYSDRWERCKDLIDSLTEEKYKKFNMHSDYEIEDWKDDGVPDKSFAKKHSGGTISYDIDTMVGPHDWHNEVGDKGDYVIRKKIYLYNWTEDNLLEHYTEAYPELMYFCEMHKDFKPILDYYLKECYNLNYDKVDRILYKLMVIQYTTPTATDETRVAHRLHNTERFGAEHCDETLGGLHLGENYQEVQLQNSKTKEYEYVPGLCESNMVWMFGEHAEQHGLLPTYHRMTHNSDSKLGDRYSIIFDLQARLKGE